MNRRKTGYAIGTLILLVYAYVAKEAARNIETIFLETIVQFSRHLIHISFVFMWTDIGPSAHYAEEGPVNIFLLLVRWWYSGCMYAPVSGCFFLPISW